MDCIFAIAFYVFLLWCSWNLFGGKQKYERKKQRKKMVQELKDMELQALHAQRQFERDVRQEVIRLKKENEMEQIKKEIEEQEKKIKEEALEYTRKVKEEANKRIQNIKQ
ncbi:MAG: hypothetical protein IKT40_08260 [Bacilli bacterium]|nr:hypothetical protein [Bacilli bacterium]